jgi:16S rRNA U516 pseudouridylate synthase RsuA-like enzyme
MERRTLDRWISRLGVASREMATEWIRGGRVRVDGRSVTDPSTVVDARARVELDGVALVHCARVVVALHKPKGYVTTRVDPAGRRTVYDLLEGLGTWVAPIGRLDRDSSGLLLLTNDTDLADRVTSPAAHLAKRYVIEVRPRILDEQLAALAAAGRRRRGRRRRGRRQFG